MVTDVNLEESLLQGIYSGTIEYREILKRYFQILFKRYGSYSKVAQISKADPRTVKKYLQ